MSSDHAGHPQVDAARQMLCRRLAQAFNDKQYNFRVRITEQNGKPQAAHFYAHDAHGWQKAGETVSDLGIVNALKGTLELLSSAEHHDAWSLRTQAHSDGRDTEMRFHPEKLGDHKADQLESFLMGLLFRDHHDSSKDVRRNIRTPSQH